MTRAFLPLIGAVAFSMAGAASAFSETALELMDRAQKDLQTRYEAKRNEKPPAGAPADASVDRTEQYTLQSVLEEMRHAREYLRLGNEEVAAQQLGQLATGTQVPTEIKPTLDAAVEQLHVEHSAREAAFAKEVDAACKRASDAVLKAKEPKDLDATLQELGQLADHPAGNRYFDGGNNRAASRLQAAVIFVDRWQDYLLARSRNNESGVSNALRNLAENNNNQPPLIPRSEILALQPQTDSDSESSGRSRHAGRPKAQLDAAAVEIVQGVKTLDDVPAALAKVVNLRKEITSQNSYSFSSDSDLGVALTSLQTLQKTALEIQNGLATNLTFGTGRPESNPHPDIDNALLPVRVQLLKLAVPRLLGASGDEKPGEGENVDAFLRRLIDDAKKRQDWDAVVRGLELKRTLAASSSNTFAVSNDQEVTAFKNFFAGRNLEQAGQYEQSVASYLTALRSGQSDLPSALIGERLAAIQKAHPTEYASGTAYALNPPPSPYGDVSRFGGPGMYRGGAYDPRFPGRPGFPGMPVDDRMPAAIVIPARSATDGRPAPAVPPAPTAATPVPAP